MDFIQAFASFGKWLLGILPKLPAENRKLREEIRGIVGQLADDLNGGLDLVLLRLRAARRIADPQELASYLTESQSQLFASFREFRVCADLRNLEDRFNRAFDPTRLAVELGHAAEVRTLVSKLEDHERLIFDMIQGTWAKLQASLHPTATREELEAAIETAIAESEHSRSEVTRIAREIVDQL